jgi:hypothetical protein
MSIRWYSVVVDCQDIAAQSRWWAEALPEGNEFCVLTARD